MTRFVKYVLSLILAVSVIAITPERSQADSPSLSGYAVNALVNAYASLGLGSDQEAPLRLQPYLVEIISWGPDFEVIFGRQGSREYRSVFVEARTGRIVPENRKLYFVESTYIPGITAGAIIAAYRYALSDKWMTATMVAVLRGGVYNLYYSPGWSTSSVAFYRLEKAPGNAQLLAAPTPSPNPGFPCSGACGGLIASYVVKVLDGEVTIRLQKIL